MDRLPRLRMRGPHVPLSPATTGVVTVLSENLPDWLAFLFLTHTVNNIASCGRGGVVGLRIELFVLSATGEDDDDALLASVSFFLLNLEKKKISST